MPWEGAQCWVRSLSLQSLCLPILPPSTISVGSLVSLATQGSQHVLSKQDWINVTQRYLLLTKNEAELYFDITWNVFSPLDKRRLVDEDDQEMELHYLLLVLYIQMVSRSHHRESGSLASSRHGVPRLRLTKQAEEESVFHFIVENLQDLETIFGCGPMLLRVLDLVLGCNLHGEPVLFSDLGDRVPDLDVLREGILHDVLGVVSCIKTGNRLRWATGCNISRLHQSRTKMATSASRIATLNGGQIVSEHRVIVISQLSHQTLAKHSQTLTGSDFVLHRCKHSYMYLPTRLHSISITKCSNSVIFSGPVQTLLHLTGCRNVTVIAAACRVVVRSCQDCSLFLLTPNRPLVSASTCHGLVFAPVSTSYHGMEDHLEDAGLGGSWTNLWDNPMVLGENSAVFALNKDGVGKIMCPRMFDELTLPFVGLGHKVKVERLPSEFCEEVVRKQSRVEEWERLKTSLSPVQLEHLENRVSRMFASFLVEFQQELQGLASLGERDI